MKFIGGIVNHFYEDVAKKILQKLLSMKKSKCTKRAHLYLCPFSLLAHLIVIATIYQI
jgi:hypothetical protein